MLTCNYGCNDNCNANEDFHAVPFRSAEYPLVQSPSAMPILIFLPAATMAIAAYISVVVFTMSGTPNLDEY
jgi:hypothetical protein